MFDGGGKESKGVFTDKSVKSWDAQFGVNGADVHCY